MEFARSGDEAMATASGRLITIETKKPSMVVRVVDMVCSSITGHAAAVTLKIWLGAGSRNSGIENNQTTASQTSINSANANTGKTMVRACDHERRRGRRLDDTALEDVSADTLGTALELRQGFLGEGARTCQPHRYDVDDAARPRAHDHDSIGQEHGLWDRMGDEHYGFWSLGPDAQ